MEAIARKLEEKVEIQTEEIEQESATKVPEGKTNRTEEMEKTFKADSRKFFTSTSQIQGAE